MQPEGCLKLFPNQHQWGERDRPLVQTEKPEWDLDSHTQTTKTHVWPLEIYDSTVVQIQKCRKSKGHFDQFDVIHASHTHATHLFSVWNNAQHLWSETAKLFFYNTFSFLCIYLVNRNVLQMLKQTSGCHWKKSSVAIMSIMKNKIHKCCINFLRLTKIKT